MKRFTFAVVALFALVAWAGTRAKESAAAPPSASTDGVALSEVTGCRASVYNDGGTINTGGTILLSYYDSAVGWIESDSSLRCTVTATIADGGTRAGYVCPDIQPLGQFGRIAAHSYGIVWSDGGVPKTRLECFGALLP